jgi:hypothetical protein
MGRPVGQGLRNLVVSRGRCTYLARHAFEFAASRIISGVQLFFQVVGNHRHHTRFGSDTFAP